MEEFGLKFIYLKGLANKLANALSRLDTGKDVTEALRVLDTVTVVSAMSDDVL